MPYKDINKRREHDKIYYSKNKDKKRLYGKEYHQKNKKILNEKNKIWRIVNKIKIKIYKASYNKKYYSENKIEINKKSNEYYYENKDKILLHLNQYLSNNKLKFNSYKKSLREKNPSYRISCYLRSRFWQILNKYLKNCKVESSKKYGIDYKAIIEHLKPFPKDLSKYHVDHIKPLCSFQFTNEDGSTNLKEIQKAFAPENHQWLTIQENLSKGGKY